MFESKQLNSINLKADGTGVQQGKLKIARKAGHDLNDLDLEKKVFY